jgi:predicted DNA-binding transcriptional regulator AlpA
LFVLIFALAQFIAISEGISMSVLNELPAVISGNRLLDSAQAAEMVGMSLPHFRRLYRSGRVPSPVRVGERKLGWRAGDLSAWLASKAPEYSDEVA